jgi:hypothetical protein
MPPFRFRPPPGVRTLLLPALLPVALAGCASSEPPPTGQIALAQSSVENAQAAGGVTYDATDLEKARSKLTGAQAALRDGRNEEARRLAEEAEVDARLAEVTARNGATQQAVAQLRQGIDTLRQEMNAPPVAAPPGAPALPPPASGRPAS